MGKVFWNAVHELDRVLRGDATRLATLRDGGLRIPLRGLSVVILVLAMLYGLCMGCFSLFRPDGTGMQVVASAIKVPALFFLTLAVTLPSLYVFNALVGSRLTVNAVLRLLIAALAVNLAVLASLGPIVAFFSVSTTSYAFMVLLNVVVFGGAGALGLSFLLQTLHRLSVIEEQAGAAGADAAAGQAVPPSVDEPLTAEVVAGEGIGPEPAMAEAPRVDIPAMLRAQRARYGESPGALDQLEGHMFGRHVKKVFGVWMIVFSLVGAQMGWVLRPFIGTPDQSFEWFRTRESNFFEAVLKALGNLLF